MTVTLTKPGDEVTLTVTSVSRMESQAKKGTFRYQIDGITPEGAQERTYANEEALTRELKHKGIAEAAHLQGGTFRFWRKAAPNNTPAAGYLNLDVLTPADLKPKAASKRLAPPTVVPGEGPESRPAAPPTASDAKVRHDAQIPLPEAPYDGLGGALDGPEGDGDLLSTPMRVKLNTYTALAREIAAFQAELSKQYDMPFDASSVNAMTATIWISK